MKAENLKLTIFAILMLSGLPAFANLEKRLKYYADQIQEHVDLERWSVTSSSDSLMIESKFNVGLTPRMNPAIGQEPRQVRYKIVVRFEKKLTSQQYKALVMKRAEHLALKAAGLRDIDSYNRTMNFLRENPLPRYFIQGNSGSYHGYLSSTDTGWVSISPISSFAESKGVEGVIDALIWPLQQ